VGRGRVDCKRSEASRGCSQKKVGDPEKKARKEQHRKEGKKEGGETWGGGL